MADNLRATEQNAALAQLARLLQGTHEFASKPFGYNNPPARMLSEMLGLPATARTVERMSYGEPLTTGRGMTTHLRPDTEEALMAVAPLAGSAARMAPQAARALAPSAAALALRSAEVGGFPVRGMSVIKPKGGNWLAGSVEKPVEMFKQGYVPDYERWGEGAAGVTDQAKGEAAALNKWLESKLGKYIKNEMGTPEDPIRALAEKGVTHAELAPQSSYYMPDFRARRRSVGFPEEGMGQSEQAKAWETAADDLIHNLPAGERLKSPISDSYLAENPWLAKVPPETMTYGTYPMNFEGQTQFGHMIDELRNAINPASGLPRELLWKYQDLDKVNIEQAVQRVHDINQWRAAQQAEANAMRANNAAAALHKDYPDAPYKWVELKSPEAKLENLTPEEMKVYESYLADKYPTEHALKEATARGRTTALEDALKYEGETMGHCVGGYCPDVLEGRSRIFSLRNKKTGEPHVTVETQPANLDHGMWYQSQPQEVKDALEAAGYRGYNIRHSPQFKEAEAQAPEQISQIKGKANKAPKEEYLPFVQDFVRSGKWGEVGDLGNTGLIQIHPEGGYGRRGSAEHGNVAPGFYTQQELDAAMKGEGFAEGGLVDSAREYSPLEVDYIIDNVHGYAQGGLATQQVKAPFNEFSMNYDVNPAEIGHAEGGLAGYGLRHGRNELKGKGYFGELPNEAGGVSTELSAEDDDVGDYPLIAPSLTRSELQSLLANEQPSDSVYNKARAHAIRRKAEGLSPYAEKHELRLPRPEGFAEGGSVESTHIPYDEAKISSLVNALREELHA